ncbi:MAG TPA: metal ABC transporter permease [Candidatus Limnocylindrales bacterium]|nr:metal ABC transporter permease [Candidatus Limnocylindrales bacterium]
MDLFSAISQIFSDYTLRNVALGGLALGAVSGIVSVYAVLRRQSLMGDVMSHAALPGIVLAFLITGVRAPLPLFLGALAAGLVGLGFMHLITTQTRVKVDSAQGVVLAAFFGFGLALLSWALRQNNAEHAGINHFLFGQAAATVAGDVVLVAAVGAVTLGVVTLFWKEFKLVSFDPGYARTLGMRVGLMDALMTALLIIVVTVGLQTVGVVLMSAMVVAPGAAARQWTNRLGLMMALASGFGALAGLIGALISSTTAGLPTGPVIVLVASVIVLISLMLAPERGLIWTWLRRRRTDQRFHEEAVLEALLVMAQHHTSTAHPHSLASIRAYAGPGTSKALDALERRGDVARSSAGWALTAKGAEAARPIVEMGRFAPTAAAPWTEPAGQEVSL